MNTALTITFKTVRLFPAILLTLLTLPFLAIEAIEDYFFVDEPHWTDRVWFYSFFVISFAAIAFAAHYINMPA